MTDQFVLLQVESLQLAASFSQSHHAVVCDTVALTQMDVLQLATFLPKLGKVGKIINTLIKN